TRGLRVATMYGNFALFVRRGWRGSLELGHSLMASLRFGEYILDPQAHVLKRGGREVSLSKKAFQLLETLVEKRPQLLSHQALRDQIWPTTFVSHTCLAGLVSDIRKVLGDDRHHPRYLRTVHGVGYAFVGEVLAESAP